MLTSSYLRGEVHGVRAGDGGLEEAVGPASRPSTSHVREPSCLALVELTLPHREAVGVPVPHRHGRDGERNGVEPVHLAVQLGGILRAVGARVPRRITARVAPEFPIVGRLEARALTVAKVDEAVAGAEDETRDAVRAELRATLPAVRLAVHDDLHRQCHARRQRVVGDAGEPAKEHAASDLGVRAPVYLPAVSARVADAGTVAGGGMGGGGGAGERGGARSSFPPSLCCSRPPAAPALRTRTSGDCTSCICSRYSRGPP